MIQPIASPRRRRPSDRSRHLKLASCGGSAQEPVGRQDELDMMRAFVGEAASAGAALVISGDAGMGKTMMLKAAEEVSAAAGARVLRAVGAEFETHLNFAGLHQILSPLMPNVIELTSVYRDALSVALGFDAGPRPAQHVVSKATMALLGQAALVRPLLVIIDDAHWLDQTTIDVLGFVARCGVARVGFLWATRSGESDPIERSGMPTHVLEALSDDAAGSLLDSCFPTLTPRVRQRLIVEAQGNPLALMELPTALSTPQLATVEVLPSALPLTLRLEALFDRRITCLSSRTRRVLLLVALAGASDLRLLRAAADTSSLLDDLAPAEDDRLISVDVVNQQVKFRHPLIRSSVVQLSTAVERREAHRALAGALLDQPDRHALHLAEATFGPDERVAAMLDQVASRMLDRGDLAGAATTSMRAAPLSAESADRARRLAFAAYHGAMSGEHKSGSALLAVARRAHPEPTGSLSDATATAYLLLDSDRDVSSAHQLLADALRSRSGTLDAEDRSVTEALHILSFICTLAGKAELWKPYYEGVARLAPEAPPDLLLKQTLVSDPARAMATSLALLEGALTGLRSETDPVRIIRISGSARYLDRLHLCREPLLRSVEESTVSRTYGAAVLRDLALDSFCSGRWDEAERFANEGIERTVGQPALLHSWNFRYVLALVAATRGDDAVNRALCDEMTSLAVPRGALAIQFASLRARTLAAIGRGDFEQAFRFAAAVSPPGTFASHVGEALFVCMDLVEAAVRTNRLDEANAHVAAMNEEGIAGLSPRLALIATGSAALAGPEKRASELFEQALAIPEAESWPFDHARVQLAYGEHLRRIRSRSLSRTHLSAALDVFKRLGARPWANRAANELRATR
jgi:AAA ATPase domain